MRPRSDLTPWPRNISQTCTFSGAGALGCKIQVSGRLGGHEMARRECSQEGSIPLATLRADIDYGLALAITTHGSIGVKCWVYRGDKQRDSKGKRGLMSANSPNARAAQAHEQVR